MIKPPKIKIPVELVTMLEKRQVILFLGRGIPDELGDAAGIPTDKALAAEMARRCDYPEDEPLPVVAQKYQSKPRNRYDLVDFMLQRVEKPKAPVPAVYDLIASLPLRAVITTIQDTSLERAFDARGIDVTPLVDDESTLIDDRNKPLLFYFLGKLETAKSLLLTKSEIDDSLDENAPKMSNLRKYLASLMNTNRLLLVGFSASDDYFRRFYRKATEGIRDCIPQSHMILPQEQYKQLLQDELNIDLISASSYDGLLALRQAWLTRRVQAEKPPFKADPEAHEQRAAFQCFVPTQDEADTVWIGLGYRLQLDARIFAGTKALTASTLVSAAQDMLLARFAAFDLRQDAPQLWLLLGMACVLNPRCFALIAEHQSAELQWLSGVPYVIDPTALETEVDSWWRAASVEEDTAAFSTAKQKMCLLVDFVDREDVNFRARIDAACADKWNLRVWPADASVDDMLPAFHAAKVVIVRVGDAPLPARACLVMGMALAAGAAVVVVGGQIEWLAAPAEDEPAFILHADPAWEAAQFRKRLADFVPDLPGYPLPEAILDISDRFIEEDDPETAWTLCDRLALALPYLGRIYLTRAEIYKRSHLSAQVARQINLASNLDPENPAVSGWYHQQFDVVAQAVHNKQMTTEIRAIVGDLFEQSRHDRSLKKRFETLVGEMVAHLESLLGRLDITGKERDEIDSLSEVMRVAGKYDVIFQSTFDRLARLEDDFKERSKLLQQMVKASPVSASATSSASSLVSEANESRYWQRLEQTLATHKDQTFSAELDRLADQQARLRLESRDLRRQLEDTQAAMAQQLAERDATLLRLREDNEKTIAAKDAQLETVRRARGEAESSATAAKNDLCHERSRIGRAFKILVFVIAPLSLIACAVVLAANWHRPWLIALPAVVFLAILGICWWLYSSKPPDSSGTRNDQHSSASASGRTAAPPAARIGPTAKSTRYEGARANAGSLPPKPKRVERP